MAPLLLLLLAALVFYTDDYVIAGVLPEIAAGLGVSEGVAGQLITVFSLTVAIAAPPAAVLTAKMSRRSLFTASLALFALANAIAACTHSFAILVGLRVCAALAAAFATPALFAAAGALVPPDKVGRATAIVMFGIIGAIALGVPAGTWIGAAFGWRWTFGALAIAGVAMIVLLGRSMPEPRATKTETLRQQLRILKKRPLALGLLANALTMAGSMMLLAYLAPFMRDLTGLGIEGRGALFALAGLAAVAGIWLGARAIERWGADRALSAGIAAIALSMVAMSFLWLLRPVPLVLVVPVTLVWAGAAFWSSPAIQTRLHALAGSAAQQAMALNTSVSYIGVAAGGALGGLLLERAGTRSLAPVSASIAILALVVYAAAGATPAFSESRARSR